MLKELLIFLIAATGLFIAGYIIIGSTKGLSKIKKIERGIKNGKYSRFK